MGREREVSPRPVSTGNKAVTRRLNAHTTDYLAHAVVKRAGVDPLPHSAHWLPDRLCQPYAPPRRVGPSPLVLGRPGTR